MADKNQQEFPIAPPNYRNLRDEENTNALQYSDEELKRKKRIKLAIYISIFAVFQVIVITIFGLTVMRVKSPKLRLANIEIQNSTTNNSSSSSSSFDISFKTQVRVKNTNFGSYKFDSTTVAFTYQGVTVGEVNIPKGKAGMKSTKKMDVTVVLSSSSLPSSISLGSELNGGVLSLSSTAKMTGKVELMLVMKKKKSAQMNCTIAIDVEGKTVRSLDCN